jgi:hypothetical protein
MDENDVRRALKTLIHQEKTTVCAWYECTAIDERTCTVLLDSENDLKVEGILLGLDKTGVVVYPVIGKNVLVVFVDGSKTNGYAVACEESDRIELMANDFIDLKADKIHLNVKDFIELIAAKMELTGSNYIKLKGKDFIELNGNDFKGLVKVDVNLKKINALENEINSLKAIISAIITAATVSSTTPVTNGTLAAYFTTYDIIPIIPTTLLELQNDKVKHGKG